MSKPNGMLNCEQLAQQIAASQIDTVVVAFPDLYGRLMGKRFEAGHFLDSIAKNGTHACDYLLTVDMEMEPVPGYKFSNWRQGYGDVHLIPDFETLRVASWLDRTALIICDLYDTKTHVLVSLAPRSILKKQLENAGRMGFAVKAASELEYYLFQTSYRDAAKNDFRKLEPAGWYLEDYHILQGTREEHFNAVARRNLSSSGVPVECTKGEWGRGQHELNVQYTDVLAMADRHLVLKQCLKETADRMSVSVTFMAKFAADCAGSSCHLHISLWRNGLNAFSEVESGQKESAAHTEIFRWFLGGWMAHVPELMVFYAPTINSYKRYQSASWAPTRLAWSHDNRTAGFRVVGRGPSLRIECRIPGADCNPYLAFAASLASGLDGIKNRIEPPSAFEGDVYAAEQLPLVPRTLREAVDLFERSQFAKQTFGEEVAEHYTHFFRVEHDHYDKAVTDWERRRYFERI